MGGRTYSGCFSAGGKKLSKLYVWSIETPGRDSIMSQAFHEIKPLYAAAWFTER